MTNLPLPTIVVDELISTRELNGHTNSNKAQTLVNHFFLRDMAPLVMPLTDPALLRRECPQVTFNSDEAARKFGQRIIGQDLIGTLLGDVQFNYELKTITYRTKGQRGKSSKALIACSYQQAQAQLEMWLKQEVIIEGVPAPPKPKPEHSPYFEIDQSTIESLETINEIIDYLDSVCYEEWLYECLTELLAEQASVEEFKTFIFWAIKYGGG